MASQHVGTDWSCVRAARAAAAGQGDTEHYATAPARPDAAGLRPARLVVRDDAATGRSRAGEAGQGLARPCLQPSLAPSCARAWHRHGVIDGERVPVQPELGGSGPHPPLLPLVERRRHGLPCLTASGYCCLAGGK